MPIHLTKPGFLIDFGLTLRRYMAFGEDAANLFDGQVFHKAFHAEGGVYLLRLSELNSGIGMEIFPATGSPAVGAEAMRIARQILGLDAPLDDFYAFACEHKVLAPLAQKYRGARPTLSATPFEMLVTSITAQQINLQFAFAVRSRMVRRYGASLQVADQAYHAFPQPDLLAKATVAELRELQFSTRKAEYIITLSQAIVGGGLQLSALNDLPDAEIAKELTRLRGIGQWTVDWYLGRYLGRGHAIAAGDLGVRKAIEHYFFDGQKQNEEAIRALAAQWGDFANLAVHYLLMDFYLPQ